ncbi:MAG: CvpA family protein [Patescibacteria group bacterium]
MLLVEIILALVLFGFVAAGWKDGLFLTLGKLIGAVLGFVVARSMYSWVGSLFVLLLPSRPGIARFIAFLAIYVLVDQLVGLIFRIVSAIFSIATIIPFTKTIGRILGAVIGAFVGVTLVGSCVYAIIRFNLDATLVAWVSSSTIAGYTEMAFRSLLGFLL